jgi:hypothetical protein
LYSNTTGLFNIALGGGSLRSNTTASNNTAVGFQAGYSNTTGDRQVALGTFALQANTTASNNTAVGYASQFTNTTGSSNSSFGDVALYSNTTGASNTAVGKSALLSNTTGSNTTAVGYQAGLNITTGTNNACFGYDSGTDAVRNITTNSNEIVMGNNSHTAAYIKVAWTVTSDIRDKTNIGAVPHGLDFVTKLNPIKYQYKVSREDDTPTGHVRYGFKAQEILGLEGDAPVIINNDDPDNLKLTDQNLIAVLVNAVKELNAKVQALESQLKGA